MTYRNTIFILHTSSQKTLQTVRFHVTQPPSPYPSYDYTLCT
ncbi:Protein of unknown function [Pyronema omphalodes CBS 100304]|uniref:Uncharacterized protein n=1 Tax=Pyronema omphalodes (strain CBS 100304) TaxID=1076935 RepID=U4LVG4_PYROM|nr:Protein of unknown function [Pyronema omphalodes CBS 100304]